MHTTSMFRLMALCAMVVGLVVVETQTAAVAFGDELTDMTAKIEGKFGGEATYTEKGKRPVFYVIVNGAPKGAKLTVAVRSQTVDQKLATMKVNERGVAAMKMYVEHRMHDKDIIEIWLGNDVVAKGTMYHFK